MLQHASSPAPPVEPLWIVPTALCCMLCSLGSQTQQRAVFGVIRIGVRCAVCGFRLGPRSNELQVRGQGEAPFREAGNAKCEYL